MTLEQLLQPLQFDFMRQALLIATIVAVPTALLSCLLVVKGWALLGDAIAHAVFPGVVLAYLLGLPLAAGAFAAGLFCAAATGYVHRNSRIKQDTVMGVVFSGLFALGLLLHGWVRSNVHLENILFGDPLGVLPADLWQAAAIALGISAWMALKWRDLLLHAFDPVQAHTMGLRCTLLHYSLLMAVSLAVVASLKAVGLVLAIALLIAPGATALLLVRTFGRMLLLACVIAVTAALLGVYLSFLLDSAPAPTIVLLLGIFFLIALGFSAWRGERKQRAKEPVHRLGTEG